jgi:hypothetical protein
MLMMKMYWEITQIPKNKNTEVPIDTSKEVELKVNTEKTKYMLLSCYQNVGQNHGIKTANRHFENVAKFRYLGMTITNQSLLPEESKRRLHSGTACYQSVHNLLSSCLLRKNIKIRIYKIILPVVLYGCETWSLTLRAEQRLRMFVNRVLRRRILA